MCAEHYIPPTKQGIYILCDPDSGAPKYVGSAFNVIERFKLHINSAERFLGSGKPNPAVTRWIASLLVGGKFPALKMIDVTRYWVVREMWWIKQFEASGFELKNTRKNAKIYNRIRGHRTYRDVIRKQTNI